MLCQRCSSSLGTRFGPTAKFIVTADGMKGPFCPACLEAELVLADEDKVMEGVRHDKGKPRTDLLPVDSLVAIAEVFRWGCEDKPNPYPERNWEKGMEWHKLYAPVLRHLFAWWSGEDRDPESGLPHIDHAATSMLMLQASVKRGIGEDDRPIERKESD